MGTVYSTKVLTGAKGQRSYRGENLEQMAFPLGGLGAGCLHWPWPHDLCRGPLPGGRGKGRHPAGPRGPVQNPFIYDQGRFGNGGLPSGHEGLPHMEGATVKGEFPFATVRLRDRDLPLGVRLEAFSPFVPGGERCSGLPAAFLRYVLRNRSPRAVKIQDFFNVQSPAKPRT